MRDFCFSVEKVFSPLVRKINEWTPRVLKKQWIRSRFSTTTTFVSPLTSSYNKFLRLFEEKKNCQQFRCVETDLSQSLSLSLCFFYLAYGWYMDENDRPLLLSFKSRPTCSPSMAVWLSGSLRKNCFTSPSTKAIKVEASTTEVTSLDNNILGVATLVPKFFLFKEENRALQ